MTDADLEPQQITPEHFLGVHIKVGRVIRAEPAQRVRTPAYKLWIDFGDQGLKHSSARLTLLYSAQELAGKLVLAVTNLPPKRVADTLSEVLVLGVPMGDEDRVVLIQPDRDVPLGSRVF